MAFTVNHSFDYHFVMLLDKLEKKYGPEMFELEGISRKHLDIAKFTNKFLTLSHEKPLLGLNKPVYLLSLLQIISQITFPEIVPFVLPHLLKPVHINKLLSTFPINGKLS